MNEAIWSRPPRRRDSSASDGISMPGETQDAAVRNYLRALKDPESLCDEEAIGELNRRLDETEVPLERLKLSAEFERHSRSTRVRVRIIFGTVIRAPMPQARPSRLIGEVNPPTTSDGRAVGGAHPEALARRHPASLARTRGHRRTAAWA